MGKMAGMSIAHFNNDQWDDLIHETLKHWRHQDRLRNNPLLGLHVVEVTAEAEGVQLSIALKKVIGEAILKLAPDPASLPTFSQPDDPRWSAERWRYFNILRALTARGERYGPVELQGLLNVGNAHYYREYKVARMMLADELRNLEGMPMAPNDAPWQLEYPSGGMRVDDPFYVERAADKQLAQSLLGSGQSITIRGSRQVGKTSLLARGIRQAQERFDAKLVYLDFQGLGDEARSSLRELCRSLSYKIFRTLELDTAFWRDAWADDYLPQETLRELVEYALKQVESSILLAMDEVDVLQLMPFSKDFFSLLRSWHTLKSQPQGASWRKLTLMMAISTEPYLLIDKAGESPFNTGLVLYLNDFTKEQTMDLNRRYDSPLSGAETTQLFDLLNGHPYLTRVALYTVAVGDMTWPELREAAAEDDGPFHQHLRWQLRRLEDDPRLQQAVIDVVQKGNCNDQKVGYHLMKAGLVSKAGNNYVCRCELYRRYFADRLDVRIAG